MRFNLGYIFLFLPAFAVATTLHVGQSQSFQSIKAALAAAAASDTIVIHPGSYQEHSLLIDKPLTLIGEKGAVVDVENQEANAFIIAADFVTITGLEIINVGISYLEEYAAIKVRNARYANIQHNTIHHCFFGIYLEYASRCVVSENHIKGEFEKEVSAGNAIHAWKGDSLRIIGNTLEEHRDGIYFEFIDDSYIAENESFNNLRYGLHFMFSNRDEYQQNRFERNGSGVAVMFSQHIQMINNTFIHNWGGASYGLLLKEISDGSITQNHFIENTVGILAEGANRLQMQQNQFTQNGTAIDMKGNCLDNRVERNNFLANTFEVVTNTKHNRNFYGQNYWSGYRGYDLNRDGVGDVPYRPVNLFSKITKEIPSATIMLHSFFVNLLEVGEKIFPQLIPAELVDEQPQMQPYKYD